MCWPLEFDVRGHDHGRLRHRQRGADARPRIGVAADGDGAADRMSVRTVDGGAPRPRAIAVDRLGGKRRCWIHEGAWAKRNGYSRRATGHGERELTDRFGLVGETSGEVKVRTVRGSNTASEGKQTLLGMGMRRQVGVIDDGALLATGGP